MTPLVGIFVGGRGSRMGGVDKGLLRAPDTGETLVERSCRICREALGDPEIVLVGDRGQYPTLGLRTLRDDPEGQGPLGGLRALLLEGQRLGRPVIALACDLPYLTPELVRRLAEAHEVNGHVGAVAPRDTRTGLWEPIFARYSCLVCLPVVEALVSTKRRALQAIFDVLGETARELSLSDEERALLRDWDQPEDVRGPV